MATLRQRISATARPILLILRERPKFAMWCARKCGSDRRSKGRPQAGADTVQERHSWNPAPVSAVVAFAHDTLEFKCAPRHPPPTGLRTGARSHALTH